MNKKDTKFKVYCENTLSHSDFKKLPEVAGVTKYQITVVLKAPAKMTIGILKVFSKLLKVSTLELVDRFGCGLDGISAREYKDLSSKKQEKK